MTFVSEPGAPLSDGFSVSRCGGCGLGVTTPVPDPAAIQSFYPPTHYGSGGPRYHPLIEQVAIWFRRRRAAWIAGMHAPGSVLEVGCGHGYLLAALRDRGWTVQGIELHEASAAYGRGMLGLPIRVGELEALRFPAASFDVVIFWHSFEHLPDPLASMRETARILKPGGLVVVAVPNASSWQARWAGPHWFHWELPRHLYHYDVATLSGLLARTGLEVAATSHANWEQNPFGWAQSALNRFGFPRNGFFSSLWAAPETSRSAMNRLLERLAAGPMLLAGFALAALETLCARGGTVTVIGRRAGSG